MIHALDNIGQMHDRIENVLWGGQPIIVAPVERHGRDDVLQQVDGDVPVMVLEVVRLAAPVVAVEPVGRHLLSIGRWTFGTRQYVLKVFFLELLSCEKSNIV
jgi:hypothetical protein